MNKAASLLKALSIKIALYRQYILVDYPRETLLAVLFGIVILIIVIDADKKNYIAVKLEEISEQSLYIHHHVDDSFLIIKVPSHLLDKQKKQPTEKGFLVSDPPDKPLSHPNYRVLALQYRHGYLLLPSNKWWQYHVPCLSIKYMPYNFRHDDKWVYGGFKCRYSASESWENKLVYDLQGKSVNPYLADLYTPNFHIKDEELRIGINSSD